MHGHPYPEIAKRVAEAAVNARLLTPWMKLTIVIDATGVGRPVAELIAQETGSAGHGGAVAIQRRGSMYMSRIGRAGASVTISRHGVAYFNGLRTHRGWSGRRPVSLAVDLAAGCLDAALAA